MNNGQPRTHSSLWRLDRDTGHGTGHSCGCRSASDNSCQLSQAVKPQLRWLLLSQSRTCIFKTTIKQISFIDPLSDNEEKVFAYSVTWPRLSMFKFSSMIIILDSSNQTIQTRYRVWKCQEKFPWTFESVHCPCLVTWGHSGHCLVWSIV